MGLKPISKFPGSDTNVLHIILVCQFSGPCPVRIGNPSGKSWIRHCSNLGNTDQLFRNLNCSRCPLFKTCLPSQGSESTDEQLQPEIRTSIGFFTIGLSDAFLSDYTAQNKFRQKLSPVGFEVTTSESSV